jgi:hypothetical protein
VKEAASAGVGLARRLSDFWRWLGFGEVACLDNGWPPLPLLPARLEPDRPLVPYQVQEREIGGSGHLYGLDLGLRQGQWQHGHERAKVRTQLAAHLLGSATDVAGQQRVAKCLRAFADALLIHRMILLGGVQGHLREAGHEIGMLVQRIDPRKSQAGPRGLLTCGDVNVVENFQMIR